MSLPSEPTRVPDPPSATVVPRPDAPTQIRDASPSQDARDLPTKVSEGALGSQATILDGRASPTTSTPPIEKRIGPYDILETLGAGGMGVVYLARQRLLNRTVALKVIKSQDGADQGRIQRFLREAQAAARLTHPGIVPVHEVGIDGGVYYYSMEYVLGQSLEEMARAQKLSPRRALELVRQVARALDYAHAEGVIHRDIKPANIMITGDGRALITDFGLAKDRTRDSILTVEGAALGTPTYMSPEQALGRLQEIDGRSDVYSLGGALYFLLTGQPPFLGETPFEVVRKLLTDLPVPVRQVSPAVNADIETICLKCLEKERDRRYASAGALAEDIDRFLEGLPITARPVSLIGKLVRTGRRHAGATVGAAALVLAACGAIGYGNWQDLARAERAAQERVRLERSTRAYQGALGALETAANRPAGEFPATLAATRAALDAVVTDQPGYREARLKRAEVAALAMDFPAAGRDLDALLHDNPEDEAALYGYQRLADALEGAGLDHDHRDLVRAADLAARRLQAHADSDLVARSRVRSLLRTGPWEAAVRAAEALQEAGSGDRAESDGLCLAAHGRLHDLEPADLLARCDAFLQKRPFDQPALRLRAEILGTLDRDAEATESWKRCLAVQPRHVYRDLEKLCLTYDALYGRADEPAYRQALIDLTKEFPDVPAGWIWLGKLHSRAGRYAEAETALTQALKVSTVPYLALAQLYLNVHAAQGPAAASAYLDAALVKYPPEELVARLGGGAISDLIGALMQTKEQTRAEAILDACRKRMPDDQDLLELTADLLFDMDRDREALTFYDRVIQLDPTQARLYARRGRIERGRKQFPEAIRDLEKAVELSPNNTMTRTQLGFLYLATGRPKDAAEQLAGVLYLTPTLELEERLHRWAAGDFTQGDAARDAKPRSDVDPEKVLASSLVQRALPAVANVLLRKGMKALAANDLLRAERSFTTACIGIPKSPDPYVCMARLNAKRESWLSAIVCLERAAELGYAKFSALPDDPYLKGLQLFPRVRNLIQAEAEKK